ncbi:hypothetical protein AMELA_G00216320 [Ameiurus melas]|uniref:Splicing factor Cactin C-terminal domain-containing protein n=1 Tax=Ameiurus melas TaxID=219545 RepID=A0A7J6A0Z4_AMEME|nr:hypothetical protein AMELA_G00216320 [Ameiurus melas]
MTSIPLENWLLFYTRRNTDVADSLLQTLNKVSGPMGIRLQRPGMKEYDDRQEALLRALQQNVGQQVKVKQLRLEREREKAMREQELEMLQRQKEAEHFKTWAEQEDNFHLHQAKLRVNKFNIFYPDLMDKRSMPQYFEPSFSILCFHSGPPYEDIAFKIVNCK